MERGAGRGRRVGSIPGESGPSAGQPLCRTRALSPATHGICGISNQQEKVLFGLGLQNRQIAANNNSLTSFLNPFYI